MHTYVETVIVGGGQAGLSVSYYLTKHARDHLVIEQSGKPAESMAQSPMGLIYAQYAELADATTRC
jgi:glycine/D-amino acid oxidase-like deaminating enzyme